MTLRAESTIPGTWRLVFGETVVATIALNELGWWCTPGPGSGQPSTTSLHATLAEVAEAVGLPAGDLVGALAPR